MPEPVALIQKLRSDPTVTNVGFFVVDGSANSVIFPVDGSIEASRSTGLSVNQISRGCSPTGPSMMMSGPAPAVGVENSRIARAMSIVPILLDADSVHQSAPAALAML